MSLRRRKDENGNYVGNWKARVYDPETGEVIEFSTKTTKKTLASQKEADFRRDLVKNRQRAIMGLKGGQNINDVLDRYLDEVTPIKRSSTQRRERGIIKQAKKFFSEELDNPDIGRMKAQDFSAFLEWKASKGVKARTVNLYRAVLHHVLDRALKVWDLVEANPLDKVPVRKETPREPRILSEKEVEKLLSAAKDPMLRLFILGLVETGARSESEVLMLRWEDIDFSEGFIHIRSDEEKQTKTGKSRWVPMSPRLTKALKDHAAKYRLSVGSPWVFCHLTPRPSKKGGVERGDRIERMYRGFKAACDRAKLGDNIRPHDLRHTFVTHKLAEGRHPVKIQHVVGHADLSTTMKYTHLVRDDLKSVVEPLEEANEAGK